MRTWRNFWHVFLSCVIHIWSENNHHLGPRELDDAHNVPWLLMLLSFPLDLDSLPICKLWISLFTITHFYFAFFCVCFGILTKINHHLCNLCLSFILLVIISYIHTFVCTNDFILLRTHSNSVIHEYQVILVPHLLVITYCTRPMPLKWYKWFWSRM